MATGEQPPRDEEAATAEVIGRSERRVAQARERAAHAGLSAARSFDESALRHESLARVQDSTVQQGAPDPDVHRESAGRHRKAAADDRELAERKRRESEADLAFDPEHDPLGDTLGPV